ncbi:alkaline phosphatase family protein [Streptomyces sp. NPDC058678]|uniref:alkaline phosphatase family protein n=1 Tax=Streptomyces sp. NPDC058678 TaxID=3346595 RepID=UPI00364782B2
MTTNQRSRKLILVGLDGFSPLWLERLMDEDRLPALAAMRRDGADVSLFSTLPATTPVAWASVSTGAWPSTHGVEGFLVHRPGDSFDRRVSGCYSTRCTAEPLWETATRAGLRSCVVKFPISYPSGTATFRLDGAAGWGGLHCLHELVATGVTDSVHRSGDRELHDGKPWSGAAPPGESMAHWRWELPNLWGAAPVELHVALLRSQGTPLVAVATEPDWGTLLGSAPLGEWSQPLGLTAPDRRGNLTTWRFRVRPLECSLDSPRLRLLNTTVHEHANHSVPAELWERYAEEIGPIEEQTEPSLLFTDEIDVPTLLDLFRLNADWLTHASEVLLSNEDWDVFMVHAHFIDWAHHAFEGGVDPRHPDFDPERRAFYEDAMASAYQLGDRLVGAVRAAAGSGADVLVVGDHGQDLHHTTVRVNELLAEAGLLTWQGDGEEVDWSATAAYAMGNYVFVNTLGRDPEGIVMPHSADEVRASIVETLLAATDPARGSRPVLLAGCKEEFEALGANGVGVGDVVFCLRSGYQARNDRGPTFAPTRLMREFTGGHDHFWPYDRRIQTRLLAAGPSFRSGYRHQRTERVIDVAPTAALALGIPAPMHNQGHPITAILREASTNDRVNAGPVGGTEA